MFLSPRDYFAREERRPRKRFGQHFLANAGTARRIALAAGLSSGDVAVEIGPGLGALTEHLLPLASRLHLVELDRDLADHLEAVLADSGHVTLHRADALAFDFRGLSAAEGRPLVLLGNLPYNISSPLVFHLLASLPAWRRAVFMVQREVGERFAAPPGGKDYGVLSVLLSAYAPATMLFEVPPGAFHPPPRVRSVVVRLDALETPVMSREGFPGARRLVSAAFSQRRKTLRNALRALYPEAALDAGLLGAGIDGSRRAETLSAAEFSALLSALPDASAT